MFFRGFYFTFIEFFFQRKFWDAPRKKSEDIPWTFKEDIHGMVWEGFIKRKNLGIKPTKYILIYEMCCKTLLIFFTENVFKLNAFN